MQLYRIFSHTKKQFYWPNPKLHSSVKAAAMNLPNGLANAHRAIRGIPLWRKSLPKMKVIKTNGDKILPKAKSANQKH